MNITDSELLQRYTRDREEAAFEEIVQRHVNLIYSAALRQVNGDAALAEEVTQSVFTDLARKAAQLTKHTSLTAWLYTSTRFIAANTRRTEQRRTHREQEAHAMNLLSNTFSPEPDWAQIRPLLDDAMHTLDDQDREAVLLRHFEHRSFAEIGQHLGLAENAARMRVARALEKLQDTLRKRGVTSTALALAGLLTANGVVAAPSDLAAKAARAALTGATASGLSVLLASLFTATKIKVAALVLLMAGVGMMIATANHRTAVTRAAEKAAATVAPAVVIATVATGPTNSTAKLHSAVELDTNGLVLRLQIVTADTGKPIPHVPVDFRGWTGQKFHGKQLVSDRFGVLNVIYPNNTTELELTTRVDEFADTKLLWRPPHGDVIPTNYVLRLDRPVAIGGTVIDEDGMPVAGAKVGWNHEDDPAAVKLPQNHEFGWIEVTTDKNGRWRINRIAEEMIARIRGSAHDAEHIGSQMVFVGKDKSVEKQLREETQVFKVGNGITIKGIVVDSQGEPIANAKILVGNVNGTDKRESTSRTNGTFYVSGCPPNPYVTASAKGYAVTTVSSHSTTNGKPLRLVLNAGKVLRLLVVNKGGRPVPGAQIYYEPWDAAGRHHTENAVPPQVEFNPKTDKAGRAIWNHAPEVEMAFDVEAPGYLRTDYHMITPDGEEHTITLSSALTVHGAVVDATTGQPIPHFRIALGWPETDFQTDKLTPQWIALDRFWLDFANGNYRHTMEESLIGGEENRGYFMKFMAEGYASVISRLIKPEEGDVQLDISLRPAMETTILVYTPDGQAAANADLGLIAPGSRLSLAHGGFSRDNPQSAGYLFKTGTDGSYKLPTEDGLQRVIAVSADGYAEALPGALHSNPVMQMQRWGKLEVNCLAGGKPQGDREYLVELGGGSESTVAIDFNTGHVTADASGQISFPMLPPGKHNLIRLIPERQPGEGKGWMHGNRASFQIRAGETTTLNLDTNYVVTGHLQWPDGVSRRPEWRVHASLRSIPSSESDGNADAPNSQVELPMFVGQDDNLLLEDVPPGSYNLSAMFYDVTGVAATHYVSPQAAGAKIMVAGVVRVTVPAQPAAGRIDLGTVRLVGVQ